MKTLIQKHVLTLFVTVCLFAFALLLGNSYSQIAGAAAPDGVSAIVATSTNPQLALNTVSVLAATSSCMARIVSTASTTLMLTFGDQVPSATFGHWQGASTTVAYDASVYGCGTMKAFSFHNGLISITETR